MPFKDFTSSTGGFLAQGMFRSLTFRIKVALRGPGPLALVRLADSERGAFSLQMWALCCLRKWQVLQWLWIQLLMPFRSPTFLVWPGAEYMR